LARKEADTDIFRNPFRSGAAVTGEYFRDRRDEVTRLAGYMGTLQSKVSRPAAWHINPVT